MTPAKKSLYERLFITRDAPDAVVEAAFRALMKNLHPDRGGEHDQALALNHARDVLCDVARRRQYDAALGREEDEAHRSALLCPHCDLAHPVLSGQELRLRGLRCRGCKSAFLGRKTNAMTPRREAPVAGARPRSSGAYCIAEADRHFHRKSCADVQRMKPDTERRWFTSRAAAAAAIGGNGKRFSPCPVCIRQPKAW